MSSNPPTRHVSNFAAAIRADDKLKADSEEFSQWEQIERKEVLLGEAACSSKSSIAMNNDEHHKPSAVPDPIDHFVPPPQGAIETLEGMSEDPAEESSSLGSNSVSTTSPSCPSTITNDSDAESSTDGSSDTMTMTYSAMKRWEAEAIHEQKAIDHRQHSAGRDMFLSRRLSRKIRYSKSLPHPSISNRRDGAIVQS
jgi:hypothetical protein